ncbi:SufE family protein [Amaricoccus tamworthensis]|uniref:SufE family protein n=1 Tax=Amaricoccus tamworthensis TaxID=57002 RepID=UPI003C7CB903
MATKNFENIVEDFEFLEDWEDRYRYVIEMGKKMPELDEALRVPATKVNGCASQVWIVPRIEGSGEEAVFDFDGDSDAMIVRGLIASLHALYSGLTISDVLGVDAAKELGRLGLDEHLSAQRSNGLTAMIARIRAVADAAKSGRLDNLEA